MDLRKALTIAWFLTKEFTINPAFKKHRVAGALILLFVAMALIAVAIMAIHTPNHGNPSGFGSEVRKLLVSMGLGRERIVDIVAAVVTTIFLLNLLRGSRIVVMSEAIRELVLSQPVDMSTFLLGYATYSTLGWGLVTLGICLSATPAILDINGGQPKALLFPLAVLAMELLLLELTSIFSTVVTRFLEKRGALKWFRIAVASYLVAALIHSLATRYVSPLLVAPFRGFAELLIYPATVSVGMNRIALSIAMVCATIATLLTASAALGNELSPEDVVPITEVRRARARHRRSLLEMGLGSPGAAVRSYVLGMSVASPSHVSTISMIIVVTALVTYLLKTFLASCGELSLIISTTATILVTMIVIVVGVAMIEAMLVDDVCGYWIYRTYLIKMDSVARALLIKYAIYVIEVFLVLSVVDTVRTGNLLHLLFPATVIPVALVASFLALLTTTYFSSKKRVVKHLHGTTTTLEDITSAIIFLSATIIMALSKFVFNTVIETMKHPEIFVLSSVATSIIVSIPLYIALSKILAKAMERYDLAW